MCLCQETLLLLKTDLSKLAHITHNATCADIQYIWVCHALSHGLQAEMRSGLQNDLILPVLYTCEQINVSSPLTATSR